MAAHATLFTLTLILVASAFASPSLGTERRKWFSRDNAATLFRVKRQIGAAGAPRYEFTVKLNVEQTFVAAFKNPASPEFVKMQKASETPLKAALEPVIGNTTVSLRKILNEGSTRVKLVFKVIHQSRTPIEAELRSAVERLHTSNPLGNLTVAATGHQVTLKGMTTPGTTTSASNLPTIDWNDCPGDSVFSCASDTTKICRDKQCDEIVDCADGSDEQNCECIRHLLCSDNINCVSIYQECDGTPDCSDGADEANCLCPNGQRNCGPDDPFTCLDEKLFCEANKIEQCNNGYDESQIVCGCDNTTQFQCRLDRNCIDISLKCNGEADCRDESDEENCPPPRDCFPGQWMCDDGFECIPVPSVCDGTPTCNDGSDETRCRVCAANERMCLDRYTCIPDSFWCDGRAQCPDQSDETNCAGALRTSTMCSNNESTITCGNGDGFVCVEQLCDGIDDCLDGSDEQSCESMTAARCVGDGSLSCADGVGVVCRAQLCDGMEDCLDGSDELSCVIVSKIPDDALFKCSDGDGVVSKHQMCDTAEDCSDGSDEQGCGENGPALEPKCVHDASFVCSDGKGDVCLEQQCDGTADCNDGSDEQDCGEWGTPTSTPASEAPSPDPLPTPEAPPSTLHKACDGDSFVCEDDGSTVCADQVCDERNDCADGSDEQNCGRSSSPTTSYTSPPTSSRPLPASDANILLDLFLASDPHTPRRASSASGVPTASSSSSASGIVRALMTSLLVSGVLIVFQ